MIRFYNSREISRRLQIPLNRWKRWSREFLPPDPLGGLQSGYARQFSPREAFTVYLGGFLVSGLGFSIPQARQVIRELNGWMKKKMLDGHLIKRGAANGDRRKAGLRYEIHILERPAGAAHNPDRLSYRIREVERRERVTAGQPSRWQEAYTEAEINSTSDHGEGGYPPVCHLLAITDLADRFASLLKV